MHDENGERRNIMKQKIRGDKRILLSGDPGKGKSEFTPMSAWMPITPELKKLWEETNEEGVELSIRRRKQQQSYSHLLLSMKDIVFEEDGSIRLGSTSKL